MAALYGGVALSGEWKPKLGLDLQGGTRITLEARTENGQKPDAASLEEARGIIDQRVNGSGVAEAEVSTQGGQNIVVEVPGPPRGNLVDTVKQTAQLRFRLVALQAPGQPQASPSASPSGAASPSGSAAPSGSASPSGGATATKPSPTATPKGRPPFAGAHLDKAKPSASPTKKPSASPSAAPSAPATVSPSAAPTANPAGAPVDQPLKWMDNPGTKWLKKFTEFTCPTGNKASAPVDDIKSQPLVTCDQDGNKFLLSASLIEGTQLKKAEAGIPQNQVQWVVNLTFGGAARTTFANVTRAIANQTSPLTGQQKQFAIVLDGKVISAPTVNGVIPNGQAEISGNFSQTEAQTLANSLKYGALPLKFTVPVVTEEGPTLASDQLSAGLIAGAIGLGLVLIYCLLYYRGLGLVVVASLLIAGLVTYAVVLAMSQAVGFTLTLPGIAGLIVAIGITADSFIVYFERIRDEMREGKSMRVAVEAGWVRARATCLAADAVSLLAAVVLYVFSIGVVKGFAFALGISTVIDLVVFFLFTKPMVSWLATFRFFYSGNKWSGLSPDHVGTSREATGTSRPASAGGNA
ncbi:protein translocase subunit SecD [Nocardioides panacis]|uniref:protein translocase subunit SecD n=1 Tax=Nocardioides panacis TaxID=2849501 RepID=UPI0020B21EB0|nr:protein translocase subunit SecD [Nocardioides panacis]